MQTCQSFKPSFMNKLYEPDIKLEKEKLRTKVNLVNHYNVCRPTDGADTPRSATSECTKEIEEESNDQPQSESVVETPLPLSTIDYVCVTKWVDYTHKYGIGYQLSNESVGVLFNDDTKIVHNLKTDKVHYFNALDMLV